MKSSQKRTQLTGVTMRLGESRVILVQCDSNEALSDCVNTRPHTRTPAC